MPIRDLLLLLLLILCAGALVGLVILGRPEED
jgi:hypothetical protein